MGEISHLAQFTEGHSTKFESIWKSMTSKDRKRNHTGCKQ